MTFKVIVPHVLSDYDNASAGLSDNFRNGGALGFGNIPGQQDWTATLFAAGAIVSVDAANAGFPDYQFERRVYQNVSLTSQTPATEAALAADTANWVFLGPENQMRPFDVQVGVDQQRVIETQAISPGGIDYIFIEGLPSIQGAAFFNMAATSVRIFAQVPGGATVTHNVTYNFQDEAPIDSDWYEYHVKPPLLERSKVITDLNINAGNRITINIDNDHGDAKAGAIVLGHIWDIGVTLVGAERSSRNTSFVEFNGTTTSLVRRLPRSGIDLQVKVEKGREKGVQRVLDDLEGVAAVFIPDEENHPGLTIYGVLRGVRETFPAKQHAFLSLRVEEL